MNWKSCCKVVEIHSCLRKWIGFILMVFMCINAVVGFIEVFASLIVHFLINHMEGPHGFTDAVFEIKDITHLEHQKWELQDSKLRDMTDDRIKLLEIRDYIIGNCSRDEVGNPTKVIHTDACNILTINERTYNYFCAIIEHPDKFHKSYRPLLHRWMATCFAYIFSIPLVLLAILWKTQRILLLVMYMVVQIVPISVSLSIIHSLWITYNFELCSLDYMYDNFPTRTFFTHTVCIRIFLKTIEIIIIIWYIWELRIERERRGYGIIERRRNRVGPISAVTVNNEILQPYRSRLENIEEPLLTNENGENSPQLSLADFGEIEKYLPIVSSKKETIVPETSKRRKTNHAEEKKASFELD